MKLFIRSKSDLIAELLSQQDTTNSNTITIDDKADKVFNFIDAKGQNVSVRGNYQLSNFLQELALLKTEEGVIDYSHIDEPPVERLSRMIEQYHWSSLVRSLNKETLSSTLFDEKRDSKQLRIYVPIKDVVANEFYNELKQDRDIVIESVPDHIDKDFLDYCKKNPGLLSLAIDPETKQSISYLVPGGRFNEMYGWDSYFIGVGLILDGKFELAKGMIDNLEYQIIHYKKILNANRSYYLSRSQPPLFTSFIIAFYENFSDRLSLEWLEQKLNTAILEYEEVWMTSGVKLTESQLNRYFDESKGIPEETEPNHFSDVLNAFALKHKIPYEEFVKQYLNNEIQNPELDAYFIHDRSMRESGYDTTYRLDNVSAHLNTVDLNSLLYKYEKDIAYILSHYLGGEIPFKGKDISAGDWLLKAEKRKNLMNSLMWSEKENGFYDYNFKTKTQHKYISVACLYPLWAKTCTKEQAIKLVENIVPKLKVKGGIVASSKEELIKRGIEESSRQWDYPFGWAPQQMIVWKGLLNYGFNDLAQELIYRWLWLMVKTSAEYNGLIPEKFDVVGCTHKINVEYGNVGASFKYVSEGGFGWSNASFKLGLSLLDKTHLLALNELKDPDTIF